MKIIKLVLLTILCVTLGVMAGLFVKNYKSSNAMPSHLLNLVGDLTTNLNLKDEWNNLDLSKIDAYGEKANSVDLGGLINSNREGDKEYDVYITANDGFMIKLDGSTLDNTYLCYTKNNGWCYLSDKHPVNSKVKNIKEIIVVNRSNEGEISENSAEGFNIITNDINNYYTKGELILNLNTDVVVHDGVSVLDDIELDVMKQKKSALISDLVDGEVKSYTVVGADGSMIYKMQEDGYIFLEDNKICYMDLEYQSIIRDCYGVIINPTTASVMDMYHDSMYFMNNKDKVMVVVIDGFSYYQYEHMKNKYPDMYMSNIEEANKATTVYRPVTNAGLAAMLTGTTPSENGVFDRNNREVLTPTIFDFCSDNDLKSVAIEGEVGILNLPSTQVRLNVNTDETKTVDDIIYEDTKKAIQEDYDYIWTHFHTVDNYGHQYGPYNETTLNQIKVLDVYIKDLASLWDGKVIILADHGMHDYDGAGSHGAFRAEDMYAPYIITNGGLYEE